VTRRLLGPRPFATLCAALLCAAIGFGLVSLIYDDVLYRKMERRLATAEDQVADIEEEIEKVDAARRHIDDIQQDIANYRAEIDRIGRILPTSIDVESEARAILELIQPVSRLSNVEPVGEAREQEFYYEYDFLLTFEDITLEQVYQVIEVIHRKVPMRTMTQITIPYATEEPQPIEVTVTSFVLKTE
jgi:hypothetical protein